MTLNPLRYAVVGACLVGLVACQMPPAQDPALLVSSDSSKPNSDTARLADVARQSGNYPAAVNLYRQLVNSGNDSLEVRLGLADSLLATGDFAGASAQYNQAETLAPGNPAPELGLGRLYLVEKQPASALSAYGLVLRSDPRNLSAYNGQGVALDLMSRHDDAQRAYRAGLAIDPTDRTLRNNLGLSLVFSKQYGQAVAILTALAQDPQASPRNRQNLALALGLEGDKANAEMVASRDLDSDDVRNNIRYYDYIRSGGDDLDPTAIASPGPSPAAP